MFYVHHKISTKWEKKSNYGDLQKRSPHDCGKNCHALYTDARHVHEHDVGHEHGHDEEDWESCTYGDIGVAGLAVFEQDLVNLGKRKAWKLLSISVQIIFTCSLHSCTCCLLLRLRTSPESFHFNISALHRSQSAFDISSHRGQVITVVTCIE